MSPRPNLKWEALLHCRGRVMEITDSPRKVAPYTIQVAEANFDFEGQQVAPDVKVKTLSDLSIFGSKQFDAIIAQRSWTLFSIDEFARLLKKGGKLVIVQQNQPELDKKWNRIQWMPEIELAVWERA